jgi:hypothetical protein
VKAQPPKPPAKPQAPKSLNFNRKVGKRYGRLSWHGQHGKTRRYRVFRNGAVVGQTYRRSMRVAVRPGATYQFAVRPLNASGGESACAGELLEQLRWYPPFRVRHVSVRRVPGKLRARLSWGRVRRGDGKLAGYRVFRDGKVYRQVKPRRHWMRVAVTPGTHEFRVVAADTRGAMGGPSRTVRVNVRHSPPTMPGRLRIGRVTDSSVELGWGLARKRSSPIAGYRIFRNGVPVSQVQSRGGDKGNHPPAPADRY